MLTSQVSSYLFLALQSSVDQYNRTDENDSNWSLFTQAVTAICLCTQKTLLLRVGQPIRQIDENNAALESQQAASACLKSKQIPPLGFARRTACCFAIIDCSVAVAAVGCCCALRGSGDALMVTLRH